MNARNHAFAPEAHLDEIDLRHVVEVHVAGGDELMGVYMDSHAGPVAPPCGRSSSGPASRSWIRAVTFEYHESYADRFGPGGVAAELRKAREIWEGCR